MRPELVVADGDCPVVCGNGVCETGESSITCPGDCPAISTTIIINEISQGTSGNQEYVELMVVGPAVCDPNTPANAVPVVTPTFDGRSSSI